jgi:hypothetical protein
MCLVWVTSEFQRPVKNKGKFVMFLTTRVVGSVVDPKLYIPDPDLDPTSEKCWIRNRIRVLDCAY